MIRNKLYKTLLIWVMFVFIFSHTSAFATGSDTAAIYITALIIGDITPPETQDDYDGLWHNEDFVITLTATDTQSDVSDTYYKINDGPEQTVSEAGQPLISAEGDNNTLECWSIDEFDNEELPHNMLTEIKLDKTPPSISILSPEDESAVGESPITITGIVKDALSGIEDVEIDIGGEIFYPVIEPDGTFLLADVDIIGGPNSITALTQDIAGNEAEDSITVFLGWVLHLKEMPYYEVGDYYSGAASCQMILNYIRNGVADELTQEEIYNYGHPYNYEENSELLEMDPHAIDYALGHFDPYDPSDPYGYGDAYKGYNFGIETFESDDFTEYLRDVIHWMAYPVTIDYWRMDENLVAWPNTPAAVPAYGTYNHWIVVNGASTDENPVPEPHTNPWYTPDFTVYGLWLTDPASDGIGQDLYATSQTAQETYLLPLVTADRHDGKYLQVAEPPEEESDARVDLAEPKVNAETLRIIEIAEDVTKDTSYNLSMFDERLESAKMHIYDAALAVSLKNDTKLSKNVLFSEQIDDLLRSVFDKNQTPIELDWKKIVDSSLLTDDDFRKAFDGSQVRSFVKVRRTDKDSFYYLIPFDKYVKGQFLTYAAIIIDAKDGSFKAASWVEEPTRFIQVSKDKAIEFLLSEYPHLQNAGLNAELIWQPNGPSESPFYPYWRIISAGEIYFVTQDGKVISQDE